MRKNLVSKLKRLSSWHRLVVPEEQRENLAKVQLRMNIRREKLIAPILLLLDVILLYVDMTSFRGRWSQTPGYLYLFFAHIALLVFLAGYISLYYWCKHKAREKKANLGKGWHFVLLAAVLLWTAALSINAQLLHGQLSAYIIGVFCAAAIALLNPVESFIFIFGSYVLFVSGVLWIQKDFSKLSGTLINSTFLVVLAYVVSRLQYLSFVNNFMNRRVILNKNKQLEDSRKELEKAVEERTWELTQTHQLLVQEMELRHQAELESMKARLLYEEENKRLNEAMEYEQLRSSFFANISHELRTPLNVIFSAQQFLALLCQETSLEKGHEKVPRYLGVIRQNCYRLIRLIGNLIDITKMDAGHFKINRGNYDIVRIVEDITLSVASYVQSHNIQLIFDTELEEKEIACDPDLMERILLNLLSNAVKFTPPGGTIYVTLFFRENKVFLSVKDTGTGIEKEKQEAVFQRFVQADPTSTRRKEGSGIGLSLVKSLVEMHDGTIRLLSEHGEGSEFIVELPDQVLAGPVPVQSGGGTGSESNIERIQIEFSDIYLN